MVMKQLSIAIAVAISFCIGLGIARPHLETFAAAPASVTTASATTIDFDGVFADVTRQGAAFVDRTRKGDRMPKVKAASAKPVLLPNCEPVASPYTDPVLMLWTAPPPAREAPSNWVLLEHS
jgi:hypothetical protein